MRLSSCVCLAALLAGICMANEGSSWGFSPSASNGPPKWADQGYPDCKATSTSQQSPINFRDVPVSENLKPLKDLFQYASNNSDVTLIQAATTLKNTGYQLKVKLASTSSVLFKDPNLASAASDANPYRLAQFHFHSPSEHTFGGGYRDAEMHFVHVNSNPSPTENKYLVLAVTFVVSSSWSSNAFLNQFLPQVRAFLSSGGGTVKGAATTLSGATNT